MAPTGQDQFDWNAWGWLVVDIHIAIILAVGIFRIVEVFIDLIK